MRKNWLGFGVGLLAANFLLAGSLSGCTGTADSTAKSSESDAAAVAGDTETQAATALSESDLMNGGMFGGGRHGGPGHWGAFGDPGGPFANLTDEQRAQLDAIRQQVENGEITPEQAHEQVRTILGDVFPEGGPHARIAKALDLTDEQQTAAEEIHTAARTDIQALVEASRAEFRALLTAEQIAALDALEAEHGRPGMGGPGFGRPGRGPHGFGPGHGPGGAGHVDRLSEALSLTEEQQAAFATIREETRTAIDARHEQARAAFRALLTEEQLAKLDEIEALHSRP